MKLTIVVVCLYVIASGFILTRRKNNIYEDNVKIGRGKIGHLQETDRLIQFLIGSEIILLSIE